MTSVVWFAVGLIAVIVLGQALAAPIRVGGKILFNSVVGGLALWVINLVGGWFGLHLGLNPVSAVIAGMLGVPGVVALLLVQWILG